MRFMVRMFGQDIPARVGLLGDYNAANCIAAVAAAVSQGVEFAAAVEVAGIIPGRAGPHGADRRRPAVPRRRRHRLDRAGDAQRAAHAAADHAGKLIVMFGAAGERDASPPPDIARAVAEIADHAVITNEDPRGEDPDAILDEIAGALKQCRLPPSTTANSTAARRSRRRSSAAEKGDTVLLAGKGTEQSIVIGTTHWPWDERRIAREVLQDLHQGR